MSGYRVLGVKDSWGIHYSEQASWILFHHLSQYLKLHPLQFYEGGADRWTGTKMPTWQLVISSLFGVSGGSWVIKLSVIKTHNIRIAKRNSQQQNNILPELLMTPNCLPGCLDMPFNSLDQNLPTELTLMKGIRCVQLWGSFLNAVVFYRIMSWKMTAVSSECPLANGFVKHEWSHTKRTVCHCNSVTTFTAVV